MTEELSQRQKLSGNKNFLGDEEAFLYGNSACSLKSEETLLSDQIIITNHNRAEYLVPLFIRFTQCRQLFLSRSMNYFLLLQYDK